TSTVLLRRDRLPKDGWFREDYPRGEDYEFYLRVARDGPAAFIDEVTTRYQVGHSDALTHSDSQADLAERFLATLNRTLRDHQSRIQLGRGVMRECVADAEAWLGRE